MVVQKAFNNLKNGPKEDKVAVASGIAVSVVVVLLVGWAIYFFHNIQKGTQQVNLGGTANEFLPDVSAANAQLQQDFGSSTQDFEDIQAESAQDNGGQMQTQQMEIQGSGSGGTDPFGTPNSDNSGQ